MISVLCDLNHQRVTRISCLFSEDNLSLRHKTSILYYNIRRKSHMSQRFFSKKDVFFTLIRGRTPTPDEYSQPKPHYTREWIK